MALIRPSELARIWQVHPKTVYAWIRERKLPVVKTPGAQYRVRSDDVRTFSEANGLALPRAIASPAGRVVLIGKQGASQRAIAKACKARGTSIEVWTVALTGLMAVACDPPDVIALDAECTDVSAADAVRALRATGPTALVPVVVYDAPSRIGGLAKLDATVIALSSKSDRAARAVLDRLEARR